MKWGLGHSYDNVEILPRKVRAYLDLTKPASSVGIAGIYFLGSIFYFSTRGSVNAIPDNITQILFVSFTILLAHGASQAMNMAEDAEMDRQTKHKQNRPIPAGIVSEEEARTIAWLLFLFALGRAYLVNSTFGMFVSVLVFFGVFYNLDPIRAKERIISIPWQAASRGLLSFPAIWAAYGNPWSPTPWILGLFVFFYVFGFQNSADIIDRHVDQEYGIKTLVVMYGVKGVVIIAFGCVMMMCAVIGISYGIGLIPLSYLSFLSIIPFCAAMLYYMDRYPHKVSEMTGNHPAWLWFYGGMVLIVVVPTLSEIYI